MSSYLKYFRHLEPYLCKDRPIVIFQDNLFAHESPELVEFCYDKQIHLYNFPSKSSHLLQPLDRMFNVLKSAIEDKRKQAMLISTETISKRKIPILLRHALTTIKSTTVQNTFVDTGLCPLDSKAIPDAKMVGDEPKIQSSSTASVPAPKVQQYSQTQHPMFVMEVDDGVSGSECTVEYVVECDPSVAEVQTDPVKSLPCSECMSRDVSLHPAVAAGVVDLDLASVFLQTAQKTREKKKRVVRRDFSKGKCLTTESEVLRMRADEEKKSEVAQMKMKRKADVEENKQKRLMEEKERKLRVVMDRQTKANQKAREREISCHQKIGLVGARNK